MVPSEVMKWCRRAEDILHDFIQKNPTGCDSVSKFIIPYLYKAQHVSGETPPIIRSLKPLAASGFA